MDQHEFVCTCPDAECMKCASVACPHNEPLHFHGDGCPSCTLAFEKTQSISHFGYCLIKSVTDDGYTSVNVHEVYYDVNNKPLTYTVNPICLSEFEMNFDDDPVKCYSTILKDILEDINKYPILTDKDFKSRE